MIKVFTETPKKRQQKNEKIAENKTFISHI